MRGKRAKQLKRLVRDKTQYRKLKKMWYSLSVLEKEKANVYNEVVLEQNSQ
jgi:hypothetical protein